MRTPGIDCADNRAGDIRPDCRVLTPLPAAGTIPLLPLRSYPEPLA